MEMHRDRFEILEAVGCGDQWSGFPELRIDPSLDPFTRLPYMWSATSQRFFEVALVASGAKDFRGLSERINVAQEAIRKGLSKARRADVMAQINDWPIFPADEPGLTFSLVAYWGDAKAFPGRQVYASLAVSLLLQGLRPTPEHDADFTQRMESQALICIAYAFGEGAHHVANLAEKARRSQTARARASAGHTHGNCRMQRVLDDFRDGTWPNKTAAAKLLAARHHFAPATVRKRLQGL